MIKRVWLFKSQATLLDSCNPDQMNYVQAWNVEKPPVSIDFPETVEYIHRDVVLNTMDEARTNALTGDGPQLLDEILDRELAE